MSGNPYHHISKVKSNGNVYYSIRKYVGGKRRSFGTYLTLADAVCARDYFERTGWVYSGRYRVRDESLKYVYPRGSKWVIIKDGEYFGTYHTLGEAQVERDSLVACGFDVGEYYSLV